MTPISTRKAQLEARLADLKGRLQGIETELDSHQSADWEELATEREGDEEPAGQRIRIRLKAYDHSLLDRSMKEIVSSREGARLRSSSEKERGKAWG